jgi:putative ABC transport system permease protein
MRRKVFTLISLFGISFTLMVLMVATAILDHAFSPTPPETSQPRTLSLVFAQLSGDNSTSNGDPGYKLIDRYLRNLPGVERLSLFTTGEVVYAYPGGTRLPLEVKRTDGEFWRILDFTFLDGAPYSAQDVDEARFAAVINESTRARLFGGGPALGQSLDLDGQHFQVVGVVADVSSLRELPFADVWVPYTTAKTSGYRDQLLGGFNALVQAADPSAFPRIKEEFYARLRQFESPDPRQYPTLTAPLETPFETVARQTFGGRGDEQSHAGKLLAALTILALLFMLLPTLNLVNLNVSRILERASEIGVRKAFGASSATLVGQFVAENLVLTLIGGAVGLALSLLALNAISASGLIPYAQFRLNYRIFLYAMGLATVFGLVSGVYPAWRMSRLHAVEALRGASR